MNYVDPYGLFAHGSIIDTVGKCIKDPLECAEEVGEVAVDVAVEASTPVAFVDALIGPIPLPFSIHLEILSFALTQVAIVDSNCSLGNMIGLTALNSMNLAVGLGGMVAFGSATIVAGPVGAVSVYGVVAGAEFGLTATTTSILNGCNSPSGPETLPNSGGPRLSLPPNPPSSGKE